MTTQPAPTILDVDWIVATSIAQPAAPEPAQPVQAENQPAVRPWAKPLLTGALALAALWLAGLAIIILDGALFADAVIRGTLGVAGIPILVLIVIAFIADPDRESPDEEYWTFGPYPTAQCTPSRNTITGRQS